MKRDKFHLVIKCLPFAFALHNAEEAWHIATTEHAIQSPLVVDPLQFIIAVSLFTILGFGLIFCEKLYPTNRSYQRIIIGFAGMLFLNSFFPHILSAIVLRSYTAGLITSLFLLLPLTTYILRKSYKLFSKKQFVGIVLTGGVVGIILVFMFLGIGYLFVMS